MYFNFDALINPVHKQFQDAPSESLKPAILNAFTTQLYVCVELLILNDKFANGDNSYWVNF